MTAFDPSLLPYAQLAATVFAPLVTIWIFVIHAKKKEQRKANIELFKDFMTSSSMVSARVMTQEYLVPGHNRKMLPKFKGKNFAQIAELLKDSERGWEVVKSIRTVAAFFWMVNEAACAKYIARRGNYLFSRAYSYYYFMVIKPHEGDSSDPMYQCFAWMMNAKDKARWQTEYESRMAEAESGTGDSTESDDRRVP